MNEQNRPQDEVKGSSPENFALPAVLLGFLGIIITTCIGLFLYGGFNMPFLILATGPLAILFFVVDLICCGLGIYFGARALHENEKSKTLSYLALGLNFIVLLIAFGTCLWSVAILSGF